MVRRKRCARDRWKGLFGIFPLPLCPSHMATQGSHKLSADPLSHPNIINSTFPCVNFSVKGTCFCVKKEYTSVSPVVFSIDPNLRSPTEGFLCFLRFNSLRSLQPPEAHLPFDMRRRAFPKLSGCPDDPVLIILGKYHTHLKESQFLRHLYCLLMLH